MKDFTEFEDQFFTEDGNELIQSCIAEAKRCTPKNQSAEDYSASLGAAVAANFALAALRTYHEWLHDKRSPQG